MSTPQAAVALAQQARCQLVSQLSATLPVLTAAVAERLLALQEESAPSREMQLRRDAWTAYQPAKARWEQGVARAWQSLLSAPAPRAAQSEPSLSQLALVEESEVENKITASRLALDLMEHAAQEVNDLRKRLRHLQQDQDLPERDVAHPEVLLLELVKQWGVAGLSHEVWQRVAPAVQHHVNTRFAPAYADVNRLLIEQGVLPVIDYSPRRPARALSGPGGSGPASGPAGAGSPNGSAQAPAASGVAPQAAVAAEVPPSAPRRRAEDRVPQATQQWAGPERRRSAGPNILEQLGRLLGGLFQAVPAVAPHGGGGAGPALAPSAAGGVPGAWVAAAPVGAMQPVGLAGAYTGPSAPLALALAQPPRLSDAYFVSPGAVPVGAASGAGGGATPAGAGLAAVPVQVVQQVASDLRQQTSALKGQAQNDNEKAIIELVALMFQAILQEDRIPTGVRVWFARLQMPVLRVALAEPDFFNRADHPARQLIDHMGSCVLGFDASGISSQALEAEIKRVVQVIEQYPETGDRVYKKVYAEFLQFLKNHLTEKPSTQQVVGVAQQLEQKETLTIRYTIELRDQLKAMSVRDEVREFLFKVWAEVLAVSAVRKGPQHEETLLLKKTATDLIWAASAKPNRSDRARVIADLPELLKCLRVGMTRLGLVRSAQEAHIKIISDTLADAFMSKTEVIADAQIQALAARLAHLEDYISDDPLDELPLDTQNIESLLGIEASDLDVVSGDPVQVSAPMLAWARELTLGAWHTLTYQEQELQVQYVWCSPMGHLHLLATRTGHSYLFQTARLAAYLRDGLLLAQEDEPLTHRATRDALDKLQANPAQLLA
ncbi:MAG: hypothetical protein Fur007_07030 [Rhodoferax sp.]